MTNKEAAERIVKLYAWYGELCERAGREMEAGYAEAVALACMALKEDVIKVIPYPEYAPEKNIAVSIYSCPGTGNVYGEVVE